MKIIAAHCARQHKAKESIVVVYTKQMIRLVHHQQGATGNKKTGKYEVIKNRFNRLPKVFSFAQSLPDYYNIIKAHCVAVMSAFVFGYKFKVHGIGFIAGRIAAGNANGI